MKIQYRTPVVTVFESALFRTTSTVVFLPEAVLVVDPNWLPEEVLYIHRFVEENRGNRSVYLLFTHADYDHIIGYEAFPNATVIASVHFKDNSHKESNIEQILQFDADYYITRPYSISYPKVDIEVKKDGQTLTIGGTRLTFYLAPGHTKEGIFTIIEGFGIWIAGDYFSNIEFPFIYQSVLAYEMTLDKTELILNKHAIQLMIPGHGDVATTESEILERKEDAYQYIRHLRKAVQSEDNALFEDLWERYHFRKCQEKFHKDNIELLKKESLR